MAVYRRAGKYRETLICACCRKTKLLEADTYEGISEMIRQSGWKHRPLQGPTNEEDASWHDDVCPGCQIRGANQAPEPEGRLKLVTSDTATPPATPTSPGRRGPGRPAGSKTRRPINTPSLFPAATPES